MYNCGQETRQYVNGVYQIFKTNDKDREFIEKIKELDEKDG